MEGRAGNKASAVPSGVSVSALIRGEGGFTYAELAVVLSLLVLLIPALMSFAFSVESQLKRVVGKQALETELETFAADVRTDIRQGRHFRLSRNGWLLFELASGETIRYSQEKRRVIRSVRRAGEKRFSGTTVLLQDVYFIGFQPDGEGVLFDIGMQNWHSDLEVKMYVRGRVTDP